MGIQWQSVHVEWRPVPLDVANIGRPLLVAYHRNPKPGEEITPRVTRVGTGGKVRWLPNAYAIADMPTPPPVPSPPLAYRSGLPEDHRC